MLNKRRVIYNINRVKIFKKNKKITKIKYQKIVILIGSRQFYLRISGDHIKVENFIKLDNYQHTFSYGDGDLAKLNVGAALKQGTLMIKNLKTFNKYSIVSNLKLRYL